MTGAGTANPVTRPASSPTDLPALLDAFELGGRVVSEGRRHFSESSPRIPGDLSGSTPLRSLRPRRPGEWDGGSIDQSAVDQWIRPQ